MAVDKELIEKFDKLFDKLDILCDSLEQKIKEREVENNMLINKKIELGNEVYLTDTCYDTTTWCQQLLTNVKSGKWVVDYEFDNKDNELKTTLSIAHEDYGMAIFNDFYDEVKSSMELGVDSGTIGIFDKDYYEKYHYECSIDDTWYENNIINSVGRRKEHITDNKGVWVNTTYGDGVYYANLYIKDNEICGIEISC